MISVAYIVLQVIDISLNFLRSFQHFRFENIIMHIFLARPIHTICFICNVVQLLIAFAKVVSHDSIIHSDWLCS